MATESFRYIEYSDNNVFINEQGRIELVKYAKNLSFYVSFDGMFRANYHEGQRDPAIAGNATIENWGVFGQHLLLENGSVLYDKNNFENVTEKGSIQFRLKPNFAHAYGYQEFLAEGDVTLPVFPKIQTTHSKFGGGALDITGGYEKYITYNINNISSMVQQGAITFYTKCNYINKPYDDVTFFSIGDETNKNKIELIHKSTGELTAKIYDQFGDLIDELSFMWSADNNWNEVSLSFDINIGTIKLFLNGTEYVSSSATGVRTVPVGSITIGGNRSDFFIDDFAIFNNNKYISNYTRRNTSLKHSNEVIVSASYDTSYNLNIGSSPVITSLIPASTNYGFKIVVGENSENISVLLQEGDTLQDIVNKIHTQITEDNVTVALLNNRIRISTKTKGSKVNILPPTQVGLFNLIPVLGGVGDSVFPNPPTTSVKLFDFYNGTNNQNRMYLEHTDSSHLQFVIYNSDGVKKVDKNLGLWNNSLYEWYAFEINWNKTIAEVFIDGQLLDAVKTGFIRGGGTDLILRAAENSPYGFDELIIYNTKMNKEDYNIPQYALTPYTTSDPYIDIHFGSGFKNYEVADLILNCSSNIHFVVKVGNKWFYYYAGEWRESNGTFQLSNSPSVLETKFSDLLFEESLDIIIRAFFHSDGYDPAWLDEISIITESGGSQPAVIVGTVSLLNPVNLSTNYNVIITTNKDSVEVDVSSAAADINNVTLEEIKQAINNAKVPGLAPASDDGKGHLILRTTDTGKDAVINISEGVTSDALDIVWGFEVSDIGSQATGHFFDYTEIYRWIRAQLGAPTVPVELTDEQLQDCVTPAVYWYNYYRNAKENIVYATLEGNVRDGWKIPEEVAGEDNIIEIIMSPRFPYVFYTGRTDLVGQVYMQWFFQQHQRDLRHMVGDYYLTMSVQKDLNNIMGTELKWHFYNGRLFLNPEPPMGAEIGIRFRSAVSLNEINTNVFIRDYALGRAKTILGTIRSTFGGVIPGGSEMLTLRGESLIAEGKEEMETVITKMQQLSEPLGFDWG